MSVVRVLTAYGRRCKNRPEHIATKDLDRFGTKLGSKIDQVVRRDALSLEGQRPGRERLCGRGALPRYQRRRHWEFYDRPHRLSGDTVEDVGEPLLGDLHDRPDRSPVYGDVHQVGRRRVIVVPQAVMDRLEVPDAPAERHETLGEKVVTESVPAIPVVRGGAHGQIYVTQFLVGAHQRPDVGIATVLPRPILPGLVAGFSRLRNRVESPAKFPSDDVVAPHVPGGRLLPGGGVGHGGSDDDHVPADQRGGVPTVPLEPRPHVLTKIDFSVLTEFRIELSGPGTESHQVLTAHGKESLVGPVRPIRKTACAPSSPGTRPLSHGVVDPKRLAGDRIDRGRLAEIRAGEQRVPHLQWRRQQEAVEPDVGVFRLTLIIHRLPSPDHFEILNIGLVDDVERRIFGATRVSAVAAPLPVLSALLAEDG